MAGQSNYISISDALVKARRYCAYRERCHYEVETKLRELGLHYEFIPDVCVKLMEEGYLNEERFVSSYVRGKFNQNKWGINKIKIGLQQKHISPKMIELGLKELDQDRYRNELVELLEKKKGRLSSGNVAQKKDKLWKYALQKGFESSLIRAALQEMEWDEG